MNTSRKKYRRSLQVHGLIRLVLLGAISAVVAGAFVVVKNRQHALANGKGALEAEIGSIHKQIETLDLRIAKMIGRKAIAARMGDMAMGLVSIERTEKLIPGRDEGEQFASYRHPPSVPEEF